MLKRFLRVGNESTIICILKFSHQRPRAFGAGLEATKVVERAICPQADVYTFLRCVFKGKCEQSSRKEGEECGSKYTTLLHAIVVLYVTGQLAIYRDLDSHVGM